MDGYQLRDHPEIVQHLDRDLLYGFDLCVTELTMQNFMQRVPPPADFATSLLKEDQAMRTFLKNYKTACVSRNTRKEGLLSKLKNLTSNTSKGFRMASTNTSNEISADNEKRRACVQDTNDLPYSDEDVLQHWKALLDNEFHKCIDSEPTLGAEYKRRVQSYSLGVTYKQRVVLGDDDTYTAETYEQKRHGKAEFKNKNISALVDSGLMQLFYAEWERCELEKNMGSIFSESAEAQSLKFSRPSAPVNPWVWMKAWLAGDVDGFKWGNLTKQPLKALYMDKDAADADAPDQPAPIQVGELVRAKYPGTDQFLAATVQVLAGADNLYTVEFHNENQSHVVHRDDLLRVPQIESFKPFELAKEKGEHKPGTHRFHKGRAAWFTQNMRRMTNDLQASDLPQKRFRLVTPVGELVEADFLSMLMMDALREEMHLQRERRVSLQCATLQRWFQGWGTPLTFGEATAEEERDDDETIDEREDVAEDKAIQAFLKERYAWCADEAPVLLIQNAAAVIQKRRARAQRTALEFFASLPADPRNPADLNGVAELIDDVWGTEMEYHLMAGSQERIDGCPHDWRGETMPTYGAAVSAWRGERHRQQPAIMRDATQFQRLWGTGDALVVRDAPQPQLPGKQQAGDTYVFRNTSPWRTSRVKHGEHTYTVDFADGTAATALHAAMIAPAGGAPREELPRAEPALLVAARPTQVPPLALPPLSEEDIEIFEDADGDDVDDLSSEEDEDDSSDTQEDEDDEAQVDSEESMDATIACLQAALNAMPTLGDAEGWRDATRYLLVRQQENSHLSPEEWFKVTYEGLWAQVDAVEESVVEPFASNWTALLTRAQENAQQTLIKLHRNLLATTVPVVKLAPGPPPAAPPTAVSAGPVAAPVQPTPVVTLTREPSPVATVAPEPEPTARTAAEYAELKKNAALAKGWRVDGFEMPTPKSEAVDGAAAAGGVVPGPEDAVTEPEDAAAAADGGAARAFFSYCSEYHHVSFARTDPINCEITAEHSEEEKLTRLAKMIRFGVGSFLWCGAGIPPTNVAANPPRLALTEDACRFRTDSTFTEVFEMFKRIDSSFTFYEIDPAFTENEVAWMLDQFPSTPAEVKRQGEQSPETMMTEYRHSITFAQCAWLEADLLQFGRPAGDRIRPLDLMTTGAYPFQDAVLHIMHKSADAGGDASVAPALSLTEALWLAMHANENPEDIGTADFKRVHASARAHVMRDLAYMGKDERDTYRAALATCTTPGQMLLGRNSRVEMSPAKYEYIKRPLFPRETQHPPKAPMLKTREITDAGRLQRLRPRASEGLLQRWYQANCGDSQNYQMSVCFPTRRPWSVGERFMTLSQAIALKDRFPRNFNEYRNRMQLHKAIQLPNVVSSMWYFAHLEELRARKAARLAVRAALPPPDENPLPPAPGRPAPPSPTASARVPLYLAQDEDPPPPGPPPAPAVVAAWPVYVPPEQPNRYQRMNGGIVNDGNSCYANALFQVLLRSKMSVLLEDMRAAMLQYTQQLHDWWNRNPDSHVGIFEVANVVQTQAGRRWQDFPPTYFVFFVTDMLSKGQSPDEDHMFETGDLSEIQKECRKRFCVFAAEYAMCELHNRMQTVESGRDANGNGHGVSLSQVLHFLYLASNQTLAHETVFAGEDQHDAGELMSFVLEVLSIDASEGIFAGTKTATVKRRTCLDESHGDGPTITKIEKGSCFVTLNLGDPGDTTARTIEYYLKDDEYEFEGVNKVVCNKCKKLTHQGEHSRTTYDEYACFYTVELQDLRTNRPGQSGRVNSNLYHMRIPQIIELPQTGAPETTRTYELIAVIQHRPGHYVAYVLKLDRWILYNDVDVSVSDFVAATTGVESLQHSPHLIFYKRLPANAPAAVLGAPARAAAGASGRPFADAAAARLEASVRRGMPPKHGEAAFDADVAARLRGFANPRPAAPAQVVHAAADPFADRKRRKVPQIGGKEVTERTTVMFAWVRSHPQLYKRWDEIPPAGKKLFWLTMEGLIREANKPAPHVPKLRAGEKATVTLWAHEILTLMAHAFFGIFDDRSHFSMTNILYGTKKHGGVIGGAAAKLKCIWSYFEHQIQALCAPATAESDAQKAARALLRNRAVTFTRAHAENVFTEAFWRDNTTATIQAVTCHNQNTDRSFKKIEDVCDNLAGACWEVDFANKEIGGGVLGNGLVQEEIRFLQCPELIVSIYFVAEMRADECIRIEGYRHFNVTQGYAAGAASGAAVAARGVVNEPFEWVGDNTSEPDVMRRMIAIDAIRYDPVNVQFHMHSINRELHKAYVGFNTGDSLPISTGHWGGGAFRGNKQLKAVIQVLAASMNNKQLHYCVFGTDAGVKDLLKALVGRRVSDVYKTLTQLIRGTVDSEFVANSELFWVAFNVLEHRV